MTEPISKPKILDIQNRLEALGVTDADLREEFIKGSGSGGQKVNKTSSCVQLTHLPTSIVVRCQKTRSREQNRFFAKRILVEKLEEIKLGKESEKAKRIHKIKAQKRKRSKRAKEKMLEKKKHVSEKKSLRKKPGIE
ncbi:MAG: peptide chain release factor-like protein [bacterium]